MFNVGASDLKANYVHTAGHTISLHILRVVGIHKQHIVCCKRGIVCSLGLSRHTMFNASDLKAYYVHTLDILYHFTHSMSNTEHIKY